MPQPSKKTSFTPRCQQGRGPDPIIDLIIDLIISWAAAARYSITSEDGCCRAKIPSRCAGKAWDYPPDTLAYSTSG